MAKKKKSPVTEMVEAIHCRLDQMESAEYSKKELRPILKALQWNIEKAWNASPLSINPYLAQALGLVKGLRVGLGEYTATEKID